MSAVEVPAAIAGSVNLMAFSGALAQAGIVGRYDADRGILVIEPARARCSHRWAPTSAREFDACIDCGERRPSVHAAHCPECGGPGFQGDEVCGFCEGSGRAAQAEPARSRGAPPPRRW